MGIPGEGHGGNVIVTCVTPVKAAFAPSKLGEPRNYDALYLFINLAFGLCFKDPMHSFPCYFFLYKT